MRLPQNHHRRAKKRLEDASDPDPDPDLDLIWYLFHHKDVVDVEKVYRKSQGVKDLLYALASREKDLRGE